MSAQKSCDNEDKTHDPINRVTPPVTNKFLAGEQILIAVHTITGSDRSFGCAIIYTDTIHYAILFIESSTILDITTYSLIGKPYMAIIASNDQHHHQWNMGRNKISFTIKKKMISFLQSVKSVDLQQT